MKHALIVAALLLLTVPAGASRIREIPKDQVPRAVAEFLRGGAQGKIVGIACDTRQCAIYTDREK